MFWDLYCAAPERRETCEHSSEAKAFHDYVSVVCLYHGFITHGMCKCDKEVFLHCSGSKTQVKVVCNSEFSGDTLELVPNSLIASTIWVTPGSYLRDQGAAPCVNAE